MFKVNTFLFFPTALIVNTKQIIECPFGKYGNSCADNCSRTCSTPHNCEGRTGNCVGGCQMGWKGVQCDQGRMIIVIIYCCKKY